MSTNHRHSLVAGRQIGLRGDSQMGPLIIVGLLFLSIWFLFALGQRFYSRSVGYVWWVAYAVLLINGFIVGFYLGMSFEYQASNELRLLGAPIPIVVFHLEDGMWVDFVSPDWLAWLKVFTNIAVVMALVIVPLFLASAISHKSKPRRTKRA